ncbi:MAG: CbiX/SirB N-terminal domain-containing protein [Halobacteria archaeon]|nr:CbiX/SirB N-terminal domain-containing protein [Halobacteria archaeon]
MQTQALVIASHGSHLNPDSDTPAFEHADTVRERGVFDEVREAFWKEEPSMREVLRTLESDVVYVVPLFVSEGYFVDEVIPRELRLADGWELDVDKDVRYTPPVGTHESMTDVIIERAESVTRRERDELGSFGIAVVGHGTERNPNSADAVYDHVERVRERGVFSEAEALFMDEEPEVDDVTDYFESEDAVVVPLFIADGYHTQEDIPEDMGLTDDYAEGWETPADVDGKKVWYSGAVGTEPLTADVVLERARDAGAVVGTEEDDVAEKEVAP